MPGNGAHAPRWTPRGRTPGGYKVEDIQVDTLQVIASTPLTRHELKEHRALGREMEDMARNHRREKKSRVHGRTHCRACDGPLPGRVEDPLPGMLPGEWRPSGKGG